MNLAKWLEPPIPVAEVEAMLKFLAIGACLMGLAACASTSSTRTSNTTPPAVASRDTLRCVPSNTATRLPPRPGECSAGDVKTYTGEDLERTGATQVGDALRYLDPEITITHH